MINRLVGNSRPQFNVMGANLRVVTSLLRGKNVCVCVCVCVCIAKNEISLSSSFDWEALRNQYVRLPTFRRQ